MCRFTGLRTSTMGGSINMVKLVHFIRRVPRSYFPQASQFFPTIVALPLLTAALSVTTADELDVLDPSAAATPPARLLYEHLQRQAHVALDKRLEEYEALKTVEDIAAYQERRREFFLRQLGGFPERTPLNAQIVGSLAGQGYRLEKVIFASQPNHHVTAVMYLPETPPPYPCVVVASGHSRTAKAADYNQRFGIIMARHGMAALCYDPIGQGERSQILDDQSKPKYRSTTTEHFQMGVGSILLGSNTARYRIWDAMRAIDYVTARDDVLATRIGFTGCSGGGTLTSYVMALDDRVFCAAPACYLTTFRRLIDTIGPQDAEQNIFGQIAFGMDHPDYVLMRAPKPTIISATTGDYFDIQGVWVNYRQAKRVYSRLGYAERVDLVEGDGGHGVPMSNLVAIMRWMRRWLLDKDDAAVETEIAVHPLDALRCTPSGQVLALPHELSVFDLNQRWQQRLAKQRARFWDKSGPEDARNRIRELSGTREVPQLARLRVREMGSLDRGNYRIDKLLLQAEDSVPLPALLFVPSKPQAEVYLYLHGTGKHDAAKPDGPIEQLVGQGHLVLAVDLPGIGETRSERSDGPLGAWKDFYMAYLLGKSLVALRAEAAMQSAQILKSLNARGQPDEDASQNAAGRTVHLVATGEASIPALHAAATSDLFTTVHIPDGIPKWADMIPVSETNNQLVGTVHGALRFYDLDDLARLHGRVSTDLPPTPD